MREEAEAEKRWGLFSMAIHNKSIIHIHLR
jgi:hypothetical protein